MAGGKGRAGVKAKDLIEALKKVHPETDIGLAVNGHSWYSPCHGSSNGGGLITTTDITFAGGRKKELFLITHSLGMPHVDGYQPKTTAVLYDEDKK